MEGTRAGRRSDSYLSFLSARYFEWTAAFFERWVPGKISCTSRIARSEGQRTSRHPGKGGSASASPPGPQSPPRRASGIGVDRACSAVGNLRAIRPSGRVPVVLSSCPPSPAWIHHRPARHSQPPSAAGFSSWRTATGPSCKSSSTFAPEPLRTSAGPRSRLRPVGCGDSRSPLPLSCW